MDSPVGSRSPPKRNMRRASGLYVGSMVPFFQKKPTHSFKLQRWAYLYTYFLFCCYCCDFQANIFSPVRVIHKLSDFKVLHGLSFSFSYYKAVTASLFQIKKAERVDWVHSTYKPQRLDHCAREAHYEATAGE